MNTLAELKISVKSINIHLKSKIDMMSLVELLNNCHPIYRNDFAHRLYKEGFLTKSIAQIYTTIL